MAAVFLKKEKPSGLPEDGLVQPTDGEKSSGLPKDQADPSYTTTTDPNYKLLPVLLC